MNKDRWLVIYSAMLLAVFAIHSMSGNQVTLILGCLMLISLLFLESTDLFFGYCLLVPNIMQIKPYGSTMSILGYFMMAAAFKTFIIEKKRVSASTITALTIHVISAMASIAVSGDFSIFLSMIRFVFFIIYIVSIEGICKEQKKGFSRYINSYIWGCALNVACSLVLGMISGKDIFSGYFAGLRNDRNYFSIMISSGIALKTVQFFRGYKWKPFDICLLGVLWAGGVLSGSRTFLLISIPSIILTAVVLLRECSKGLRGFFITAISIAAVVILSHILGDMFVETIERFSYEDVSSGNGRFDAWHFYINETCNTISGILFGIGSSTQYVQRGLFSHVEHNTLIQIFVTLGIFGFTTMMAVYFVLIRGFHTSKVKCGVVYIPLIVLVVGNMTINNMYADFLNLGIVISAMLIEECSKGVALDEHMHHN